MHVLIVKMSSMGDLIHTLPALTDAAQAIPGIRFDWVVEPAFAEVPAWHPNVERIIQIRWRDWRKNLRQSRAQMREFYNSLRQTQYDAIIDAQGLLKSMVVTRMARGVSHGPDFKSARESLAGLGYNHAHSVNFNQHAIRRARQLFALSLGYPLPEHTPQYGINRNQLPSVPVTFDRPFIAFLHGTTWATKHWPEAYWQQLVKIVTDAGFGVALPWGNEVEQQRAQRLAAQSPLAQVLPKLKIAQVGTVLTQASAAVVLDSGLGHLAAALTVPAVSLYGPTDPRLIGMLGANQIHLKVDNFQCPGCSADSCKHPRAKQVFPACFADITPDKVWASLEKLVHIKEKANHVQL